MTGTAPATPGYLVVRNLGVRYGSAEAVRGVDLDIGPGSVVALLGANGAGKSTVLKAIAGLVRGTGTMAFGGETLDGMPARKRLGRGIVYVPEGREIVGILSVSENLTLGGYHCDRKTRSERAAMVLDLFPEIASRARSPAGMLSGGEQQMLAIGRALMAGPRVLLLDEPSLGLAPLLVQRVFERLDVVRRHTEMSILLVEQNFRMTVQLADDAYFMRNGRVVAHQAAATLRTPAARQAAIEAYLGSGESQPETTAILAAAS